MLGGFSDSWITFDSSWLCPCTDVSYGLGMGILDDDWAIFSTLCLPPSTSREANSRVCSPREVLVDPILLIVLIHIHHPFVSNTKECMIYIHIYLNINKKIKSLREKRNRLN